MNVELWFGHESSILPERVSERNNKDKMKGWERQRALLFMSTCYYKPHELFVARKGLRRRENNRGDEELEEERSKGERRRGENKTWREERGPPFLLSPWMKASQHLCSLSPWVTTEVLPSNSSSRLPAAAVGFSQLINDRAGGHGSGHFIPKHHRHTLWCPLVDSGGRRPWRQGHVGLCVSVVVRTKLPGIPSLN